MCYQFNLVCLHILAYKFVCIDQEHAANQALSVDLPLNWAQVMPVTLNATPSLGGLCIGKYV